MSILGASAGHLPGHPPRPIDPDALSGLRWDASVISLLTGVQVRVYRGHSRAQGWSSHGGFDVFVDGQPTTVSSVERAESYLHGVYAGLSAATALAEAALAELGDPAPE
jgi:hypothetical protein